MVKQEGEKNSFLDIQISTQINDPEWDDFLNATSGGSFMQTSLWCHIKGDYGWQPVRLILKENKNIVAGAQFLIRKLPLMGFVGYISKGPVILDNNTSLLDITVNEICKICKKYKILNLILQPPDNGEYIIEYLKRKGFKSSKVELVADATLKIDLTKDLDTILCEMKKNTRLQVNQGLKRGVTVREGTEEDIEIFFQLMLKTCERKGVSPHPSDVKYLQKMWKLFNPKGHMNLLMAEYEGKCIAASLNIPFSDTLTGWKVGWNREESSRRPNYLLDWMSFKWGKERGYKYFDFLSLETSVAKSIVNNEPLPDMSKHGSTNHKLSYGGEVYLLPGAYEYVYNPVFRLVYQGIFNKLMGHSGIRKIVHNTWLKLNSLRSKK